MNYNETDEEMVWAQTAFLYYASCSRGVNNDAEKTPWPATLDQARKILEKDLNGLLEWIQKELWCSRESLKKMSFLEIAMA